MQPHSACTAMLAEEQRRDRQPTTPKAAKLSPRAQAKEAAAPSVGDGNMTLRHAAKGLNTTDRARKTRARTASRSCFPEKVMFSGKTKAQNKNRDVEIVAGIGATIPNVTTMSCSDLTTVQDDQRKR